MQTDFLIIGSGISGLNFALHAAEKGRVILVTKKKLIDSNTNYAQGGIAAVLDKTDNIEEHIEDSLKAGAYHNKKSALRFMVQHSAEAIHRLIELGVKFEQEKGGMLKLTREGGHKKRRIAYVGDYTGKEIEHILVTRVKENSNITIMEDTFALELITKEKVCYGAQVIHNNKILNITAAQTILATGGIGQLFQYSTNPNIATGDGLAMAYRAGCTTKDLEFIQFHPTAFAKKLSPRFLLSEALRGEGAKIYNEKGQRFIKGPQKELAPRDIVAREIYKEGIAYLDITHKSEQYLKKRFPKIHETLKKHGYNLAKDRIPITPAAHYLCGGIKTDLKGKTNIKNLFAFGEVTCTGVHGANRLASNSLLEALVFSNQIIQELKPENKKNSIKANRFKIEKHNSTSSKTAKKLRKDIQRTMWKYAGIIRSLKDIQEIAIPKIQEIEKELKQINTTNQEIAETKNMCTAAKLILNAALKRPKSLGCHFIE